MKDETICALELFIEKARTLKGRKFIAYYETHRLNMEVIFPIATMEGRVEDLPMPDEEDISAFVTVLRFFVLKQEKSSFRSLATILDDHDLSARWKTLFEEARANINSRKDETHEKRVYIKDENGNVLTDGEIFDVFVNGDISHCEIPKRERFQKWKADENFFKGVTFRFLNYVLGLSYVIFNLACATELELEGRSKAWMARNSRIPEGPLNKFCAERGWMLTVPDK